MMKKVEKIRRDKNLSLEQFVHLLNNNGAELTCQTYRNWLGGKCEPSAKKFVPVARALRKKMSFFYED
jgi:transcriptional regulator with XRE-family HTH domain